MNRSIRSSVLAFGGVALMALWGCSQNEPPKQPTSSPTFESDVGTSPQSAPGQPTAPEQPGATPPSTPSGPPESPQGATPREGPSPGQPGDSSAGRPSTGHEMGGEHGGAGAPPQGPAVTPMPSERDLCDTLTRDAKLQVEDAEGGVTLILKPRASRDLAMLREHARQIGYRAEHSAGSSIGPSCVLFAIGRGGATTAIAESPDAVRILITTSDSTQVQSIRRQVREFVNKGADKSGGQGSSPKQGSGSGSGQ